jgi:hypothetical protein
MLKKPAVNDLVLLKKSNKLRTKVLNMPLNKNLMWILFYCLRFNVIAC